MSGASNLATIALLPILAAGILGGWVAAWISHRYRGVEDAEGYEIAELADATCVHCDHVITLAEASPINGLKCSSCGQRLPWTWAATMVAVVLGSVAMLATWGPSLVLIPFLWLVPVVVTAATIDYRTMLIPKRVVWIGFGIGLVSIVLVSLSWGSPEFIKTALIGSVGYFGFLFIAHMISPSGMGFGDVRLATLLGLYLGWVDIRLPLFGLLLGNLAYLTYALPQRMRLGKEAGKFAPFGPGLAMGTLLAIYMQSVLI